MRKLIIILSIIFCYPQISFSEGTNTPTSSFIKNVKVYLQGAFITRTVKSNLAVGNNILEVKGLSSGINAQSISVKGSGDFTILSVNKQINFIDQSPKTEEVIKLEEQLEKLQFERNSGLNLIAALNEEQSVIQANKKITGDNTALTLQALQSISTYVRTRTLEIKDELIKLQVADKKKQEEINKVNNQLNILRSKTNRPSSRLEISVRSKVKQTVDLEITYMINDAGWRPFYDLRVDDVTKPLNMEYKAQVYQNSGVDWNKVDLTLSTGNPSLGGTKPILYPWFIDFYQAAAYNRTNVLNYADKKNIPSIISQSSGAEMDDAGLFRNVNVQSQETSVDFNISIPYSVPSDGKEYLVDIQKFTLPAIYRHAAVPKLDKDAFLTANVTGWDQFNLLAGSANIYFEGAYVAESFIDPRNTKDSLLLSLGRDKSVVVTREKLKDFCSTKTIGSNTTVERTYEITVRNTKKKDVSIVIEDQVPVSKQKDIEIKVIEKSGADYDAEKGLLVWRITLKPGETVKRKLNFSVKYPKDKQLQL